MTNELLMLHEILDDSSRMIQVSECDTFSILYANKTARDLSGHIDQPKAGEYCYKYLGGLNEPCPFCPMRKIGNLPEIEIELESDSKVFAIKVKRLDLNGRKCFVEYVQDITVLRQQQRDLDAALTREKAHLEMLQEDIKAIEGLASEYELLHFLNLETSEYSTYYVSGRSKNQATKQHKAAKTYFDAHITVMNTICHPDYLDEMLSYADIDVIRNVLHNKKRHVVRFLCLNGVGEYEWTAMVLVKFDDIRKDATRIAIGYYNIDGEIKEKLEQKDKLMKQQKMLEEKNLALVLAQDESKKQLEILNSLSKIYNSMHIVNLNDDTVFEYFSNDLVRQYVNQQSNASSQMRLIMNYLTVAEYKERVFEFTDLLTLQERMIGKKTISLDFLDINNLWVRAQFITIKVNEDSIPISVIFTTQVVDEEKRKEEKLVIKSKTDELTRFLNRRAFDYDIKKYELEGIPDDLVLFSMDVNSLKITNDTYGHAAGDELIKCAAYCIKTCFEGIGKMYRTGGDEFAVILTVSDDMLSKLLKDFEVIMSECSTKYVKEITFSIGYVSRKEFPTSSFEEMEKIADQRMYESKDLYYSSKGMNRRGQIDAYHAICASYIKILKVNLTKDTYQIIRIEVSEKTKNKGFSVNLSTWMEDFATSGQVHPDDCDEFITQSNITNMSKYFIENKTPLSFFYRRMHCDHFCKVMMELIPAKEYTDEDQVLFLYVKDIGK